ncbi:MAG: PHP domain-containing protein [Clostridia bacterium]|nr:PHP domain-containing protein [Clostridia bacterium]
MVILGDYHTHTIYSSGKRNSKHATGTILENALIAKEKGLTEIAITDHGFSHKLYGLQRKNLQKMREEIDFAMQKTGVKIYLGVEANIISRDGDIDVNPKDLDGLDMLIVGFHSFAKPKNCKEFFKFFLPNILGFKRKKDISRNTLAILKAMDKYNIDIISHPGVNMPMDFNEVSKQAQKTNTYLEINGKRIAYTTNDVQTILNNNAKFVIDSDAHSPQRVGECSKAVNFAIKNNIPYNAIANMGNTIKIKKQKGE